MAKRSTRVTLSTPSELASGDSPVPTGEVLADDGLVTMVNGDVVLRVHPTTVDQHIRLGWRVWPIPDLNT